MHAKPISYLPNKNISFQLVLRIIRLGDHSVRANPTASKDIFPCCILLIYLSCEAQNPRPFGRGVLSLPAIRVPALCRRPVQPTGTFNVICLFLFPTVRKFFDCRFGVAEPTIKITICKPETYFPNFRSGRKFS